MEMNFFVLLSWLLFISLLNTPFSYGVETISGNKYISLGTTISSSNERFELGFFKLGQSSNYYIGIWYKNISPQTVVWVANRITPIPSSAVNSSKLKILDRNLVLVDRGQNFVWSTNISTSATTKLSSVLATLGDDGNLVLSNDGINSTTPLWQSFDHPTNTFLPGAKLGYNKRTKTKLVYTSWKNLDDPAPGLFSIDNDGNMSFLLWNGTEEYVNTGPNFGFGTVHSLKPNPTFNFTIVDNENESYFTYTVYPSVWKLKAIIPTAAALILACSIFYLCYKRRRTALKKTEHAVEAMDEMIDEDSDEKGIGVQFFTFQTILEATDNFSNANKLGKGGFGPVYKGMLPDGQEIAVKRLSSQSGQGINEFKNEVVLIAKLQHRNLVKLVGYCTQAGEKMLLYEYMPNKSLDTFIFDQTRKLLLDWSKRFDIILGIARGLVYLHHDSRLRIIHRDMKTNNILLDDEMTPKISDFGLARMVDGNTFEANTKKVVGTYGYMSPEYALSGLFSIKSDVFSFGVIILEIICGKKNTAFYQHEEVSNLLGYAWKLWNEGNAMDLLDDSLLECRKECEALKCVNVGLLCVEEDPNCRPSMPNVLLMLTDESMTLPKPNQPAFVTRTQTCNDSSIVQSDKPCSNQLTFSEQEGR